jgi:Family of unknown function (DUF6112)
MQRLKRIARSAAATITGLGASLTVGVTNAFAAGGGSGVNISANSSGLPGLTQSETIVGALITLGVIASVAGLALSAMVWAVGNHSANPQVAGRGKTGVLVSSSSAVLCGGAMAIVNFFFNIGAQI